MSRRSTVYVARPVLPPLEDVVSRMETIWETRFLTNQGSFVRSLEESLCTYLGVQNVSMVANCTLGLVLALRALRITGEVITTPFSFVATSNAIVLAGAEPVFADIDPDTLNLSPKAVEARITERTQAIVAVHSFGTPCDLDGLQEIADRHGIPLVFDAAHSFGVRIGNRSLLDYGTCAVVSFHATKVFNTFEGGAVITRDGALKRDIDLMANHGIDDEVNVPEVGLNAKMSELHAAVGLAQLPHVAGNIAARGEVVQHYIDGLTGVPGIDLVRPPANFESNNYMFPIMVGPDYPVSRDTLHERLKQSRVFARRYFFPLISDLPNFRGKPSADPAGLPVARNAAERILCLPLYPDLEPADRDFIIRIIRNP